MAVLLTPWQAAYPDVPVGVVSTHGSAAPAPVAASRPAQLVVGSAGRHLLHHADRPVYRVGQR